MTNRISRSVLCLVVAFATAFGWVLPHGSDAVSHDPVPPVVVDANTSEHGHSHNDGEGDERADAHFHGHNPADHSHETPTTPPAVAPALQAMMCTSVPLPPHTVSIGGTYRLERPPRPIVIA